MFEFVKAGGWLMIPILAFSVVAVAICLERLWALNSRRLVPEDLLADVWTRLKAGKLDNEALAQLRGDSALGLILAAGLNNANAGRDIMKESIGEAASYVIHDMERYLNTLGTIASVSPLMGLLGTVIGMITVFSELMLHGTGNVAILAGGISQALITTASGITVAIPALMMHRYFQRKIDTVVVTLEQEAIKLVDALYSQRDVQVAGAPATPAVAV
ncbi:MAG: MotA/TolQ/ExbB proton channel family protein [Gammaproteobacteria bacterium]|nr:MotA/TolQ/ExbB proton channel family protein [Gammaproteobacteria bacterium]NND40421.1 MotA/TolQ/ExbB proton channel family protein [Pseudomonadales bacterium]MBT8151562.1 MotA/TolQ/ExbB proton channel family protein [Gammaproteobacteria bacterium]NNL12010.1 MotA/TolQ/ExbB proton channel family protein [Pseudomonadales bacterium]NNM12356.1 MotA/TolQ/ExbB proton channel family protein [Pseudomonadales bacterium]